MTLHALLLYLMFVLVATASPGPAVLFATTNSLLYGWRRAVFAALGNITGLFCLALIAIAGLGSVLKTSVQIYIIIKYAGAAYLIYLGIKMILQKDVADDAKKGDVCTSQAGSKKRLYVRAFGVAISNPKAIIFLTALFPQFVNVDLPVVPQFLILIAILMLFSFSMLVLYSVLVHQARDRIKKRWKIINKTSGGIFVGFGLLLAASGNK